MSDTSPGKEPVSNPKKDRKGGSVASRLTRSPSAPAEEGKESEPLASGSETDPVVVAGDSETQGSVSSETWSALVADKEREEQELSRLTLESMDLGDDPTSEKEEGELEQMEQDESPSAKERLSRRDTPHRPAGVPSGTSYESRRHRSVSPRAMPESWKQLALKPGVPHPVDDLPWDRRLRDNKARYTALLTNFVACGMVCPVEGCGYSIAGVKPLTPSEYSDARKRPKCPQRDRITRHWETKHFPAAGAERVAAYCPQKDCIVRFSYACHRTVQRHLIDQHHVGEGPARSMARHACSPAGSPVRDVSFPTVALMHSVREQALEAVSAALRVRVTPDVKQTFEKCLRIVETVQQGGTGSPESRGEISAERLDDAWDSAMSALKLGDEDRRVVDELRRKGYSPDSGSEPTPGPSGSSGGGKAPASASGKPQQEEGLSRNARKRKSRKSAKLAAQHIADASALENLPTVDIVPLELTPAEEGDKDEGTFTTVSRHRDRSQSAGRPSKKARSSSSAPGDKGAKSAQSQARASAQAKRAAETVESYPAGLQDYVRKVMDKGQSKGRAKSAGRSFEAPAYTASWKLWRAALDAYKALPKPWDLSNVEEERKRNGTGTAAEFGGSQGYAYLQHMEALTRGMFKCLDYPDVRQAWAQHPMFKAWERFAHHLHSGREPPSCLTCSLKAAETDSRAGETQTPSLFKDVGLERGKTRAPSVEAAGFKYEPVETLIQREVDRRVAAALAKEKGRQTATPSPAPVPPVTRQSGVETYSDALRGQHTPHRKSSEAGPMTTAQWKQGLKPLPGIGRGTTPRATTSRAAPASTFTPTAAGLRTRSGAPGVAHSGEHDWTWIRDPSSRTFRPTSSQHGWEALEPWEDRAQKAVTLVLPEAAAHQLQGAVDLVTNILGTGVYASALPDGGDSVRPLCETVEDVVAKMARAREEASRAPPTDPRQQGAASPMDDDAPE